MAVYSLPATSAYKADFSIAQLRCNQSGLVPQNFLELLHAAFFIGVEQYMPLI